MRMRLLIIVLSLTAAGLVFAQAYRWEDEDGVVHFSDRPQPGAEVVDLPRSPPQASVEAEPYTREEAAPKRRA